MANLKELFGYQKIAGNKNLEELINETHSRYGNGAMELSDDELEMAAGGKKVADSKQTMKIACQKCQTINEVDVLANSYVCKNPACKTLHYING